MRPTFRVPRAVLAAAGVCIAATTLAAQAPALDACSVLTREEIKTLTGRDPGEIDMGESLGSTTCRWPESSPSIRVALYPKVDPNEPKGLALKQLKDRGLNARAIDGLATTRSSCPLRASGRWGRCSCESVGGGSSSAGRPSPRGRRSRRCPCSPR